MPNFVVGFTVHGHPLFWATEAEPILTLTLANSRKVRKTNKYLIPEVYSRRFEGGRRFDGCGVSVQHRLRQRSTIGLPELQEARAAAEALQRQLERHGERTEIARRLPAATV